MPETITEIDLLKDIGNGIGPVELDRGGYWSGYHHIWVDKKFPYTINKLPEPEIKYIETLGNVCLIIGQIFTKQLNDASEGRIWPKEIFEKEGVEKLMEAIKLNPSIEDPFSLISNGLNNPTVPYSQFYSSELGRLNKQLKLALQLNDSSSAQAHAKYIKALIEAYTLRKNQQSDLYYFEEVDKEWVKIPPNSTFLILAEPTEVYHDPARVAIGQNRRVIEWVNKVTDNNGLGPWRPFFEFRLLMKDKSMVTEEEIQTIRKKSRELYSLPEDKEVPVSLEFRRLLLSSGNGAHPAKTAKNYPNFEQIRGKVGYKNVLYTNMIEEGTLTQVIPALKTAFGEQFINQFSEQSLVRGSSLRVVGHEENHPFKIFRDTPLEELKSTVNGIKAIIESGKFTDEDVNAAMLTVIGVSLYGRKKMVEAKILNDWNMQAGLEGYYKGDTILLNYLMEHQCFREGKIDFTALKTSFIEFAKYLEEIHNEDHKLTVPQVYTRYYNENIWMNFNI
jgi:hypothetical protein